MVVSLATVVFILDQASKAWITAWLGPTASRHRVELVEPMLALHYARNSGAAFGLFGDQGVFLAIVAAVVIAALLLTARHHAVDSSWLRIAMGLITGGAAGNLIDRVRLGYVTDFIDVGRWPTFNLADSAITIGIAIVVIHGFVTGPDSHRSTGVEGPP